MTLYSSQLKAAMDPQHDLQRRFRVHVSSEPVLSIPGLPGDPVVRVVIAGAPEAIAAAIAFVYQFLGVDDPNPQLTKADASGYCGPRAAPQVGFYIYIYIYVLHLF